MFSTHSNSASASGVTIRGTPVTVGTDIQVISQPILGLNVDHNPQFSAMASAVNSSTGSSEMMSLGSGTSTEGGASFVPTSESHSMPSSSTAGTRGSHHEGSPKDVTRRDEEGKNGNHMKT